MVYVCGIFPALLGHLTVLFPEPQNSHHRNDPLMSVSTQLLCLKFDVIQNLGFFFLFLAMAAGFREIPGTLQLIGKQYNHRKA